VGKRIANRAFICRGKEWRREREGEGGRGLLYICVLCIRIAYKTTGISWNCGSSEHFRTTNIHFINCSGFPTTPTL